MSLCGRQSDSQCLHRTFHCPGPGQDADRLAGTRCSGNTCVVQDSLTLPHFIVCVKTLSPVTPFKAVFARETFFFLQINIFDGAALNW